MHAYTTIRRVEHAYKTLTQPHTNAESRPIWNNKATASSRNAMQNMSRDASGKRQNEEKVHTRITNEMMQNGEMANKLNE